MNPMLLHQAFARRLTSQGTSAERCPHRVVVVAAWDQAALEDAVERIAWGPHHLKSGRIATLATRHQLTMRAEGLSAAEAMFAGHLYKLAAQRHLAALLGRGIGSSKWEQ